MEGAGPFTAYASRSRIEREGIPSAYVAGESLKEFGELVRHSGRGIHMCWKDESRSTPNSMTLSC